MQMEKSNRPDRPVRPTLKRRGSVKERFDALVEDTRRKEELRLEQIRNSRMSLKHIPSVKNRWSQALTNMRVQETEKLEAVKAANKKGYEASGEHIVDSMTKNFDSSVYIQKQLSDSDRDRVDTRVSQGTLIVISKADSIHTLEAGTAYTVDLSTCGNEAALREALLLSEDKELSMQVAITGAKKEEPKIDVTSLAQLRNDGSLVLGFLIDVHKEHEQNLEVYGDYRIDQFLPITNAVSDISPTRRPSFAAALILQMRVTLVPYGGWTFFHTKQRDPTYTIEKRESKMAGFKIRPVASFATEDSKSDCSPTSSSYSFAMLASPNNVSVDDGVLIYGGRDRTPPPCMQSATSPVDMDDESEDLERISAEEARDAVAASGTGAPLHMDDGFVLIGERTGDTPPLHSSSSDSLDIVCEITPCLLYHECHKHRLIPSVMLHPETSLLSRLCVQCAWEEKECASPEQSVSAARAGAKTLEFACPDCAVFVCSECAYKGNGVIGSMETQQILLNWEVLFEGGYSTLKEESYGMLEQVGRLLLENPIPVRIEGHINTVKSSGKVLPASSPLIKVYEPECDGQTLSERRANMVALYLQAMGVSAELLQPVGCGGERPITRTKKNLDQNRRVEIHLIPSQST